MRYSNSLHSSRRHNALKNRRRSGLISICLLIAVLIILSLFANFSNLNMTKLFGGFTMSFFRTTIAYVIALFLSIVIALATTSNEKVENFLLPILDVLQSFPSFALFPVLITSIHNSEIIVIFVLVIANLWPILFTLIGGIKNRHQDIEEAATIFGAKGMKRLWFFTIPELAPSIITGSIIGWSNAWEFIIGAELLVNNQWGIGSYLGELGNNHQNYLLAIGIVILMLILFIINKIFWLPLLNRETKYQSES